MPRPSTIDRLPADILAQLHELLRDPRVSQLDATAKINAVLEADGHEDRVSKSAVNRYSMRMEEVGARLRQSRQVAEMWVGKLGSAPQGQVGKLLNEIIRTLAFETAMDAAESGNPVSPKMLKDLAIAVQRLESAANMNDEREAKIREAARKAALEEAAGKVEEAAKASKGMTRESIDTIKREILGIA
jgi:hypothetical protein